MDRIPIPSGLKLREVHGELQTRATHPFKLEELCFKEQLGFIRGSQKFKALCTSRRAGKTVATALYLIQTALTKPGSTSLYLTLSRGLAKKLIWPILKDLNQKYVLGFTFHEVDLAITARNGARIYIAGSNTTAEIEKIRGFAFELCIVDEAQSFRAHLGMLVNDVIVKTLYDYDGTLCLVGTPGPVKHGFFYEACHNPRWGHFSWTLHVNPHIQKKSGLTPAELIRRDCEQRGVTLDHPSIRRECFGEWVIDPDSLVFAYRPEINHFDQLPDVKAPWSFIMGIDVGFLDSDSISVVAYSPSHEGTFLVEEHLASHQSISELVGHIKRLTDKYSPDSIVMDTGGLGKKIAVELNIRHGLGVKAADKAQKLSFIELLNDACRTQKFFARKDSQFAQDCQLIEWDRDKFPPRISEKFHSDATDSCLYAWRESLSYLYEPLKQYSAFQTPKWFEEEERALEEAQIRQHHELKEELEFLYG